MYPQEALEAKQQPSWPDEAFAQHVVDDLSKRSGLVKAADIATLRSNLASVAVGEAFVLQIGSCAEQLTDGPTELENLLNVQLPMNMVLSYTAGLPVVKIGRLAGQFGKPRSSETETRDDVTLPSYRGDIVNGAEFTLEARTHDPLRMLHVYDHAKETIGTLNELASGGYASIENIHNWNISFAERSQDDKYLEIVEGITRAIRFMKSSGVADHNLRELYEAVVFTSHEGLVLDYERALTRQTKDGKHDTSAHMLWIGERTRGLNDAHVEFFSKVENPVGVKIGPSATTDEVIGLCERLDPAQVPGRLTLIARMGSLQIREALPPLISAVIRKGYPVVWVSDPMHGNTKSHGNSHKTRHFDDIVDEVEGFFDVCEHENVWPGGLHLEVTGEPVTECLGGGEHTAVYDLNENYTTSCDPRLNPDQGIELAFRVAERFAKYK